MNSYDLGYDAAWGGYTRGDNPYEEETEEADYRDWLEGFYDGEAAKWEENEES